jgi:hypothetical protein
MYPFSDCQYVRWYGGRKWRKMAVGEKKDSVYMRPVYTHIWELIFAAVEADLETEPQG